jgi:L-serine dehydratase
MPQRVDVRFFGSFAATYRGHGTDVAITGGLLDWDTDDVRIPTAPKQAASSGMEISFTQGKGLFSHPNTVRLLLTSEAALAPAPGTGGENKGLHSMDASGSGDGAEHESSLAVAGISIGGGNIEITEIDRFSTKISGMYPTLVIRHLDWTGVIANISAVMKRHNMNIGYMSVDRRGRNGAALTVLELDAAPDEGLLSDLRLTDSVASVHAIDLTKGSST